MGRKHFTEEQIAFALRQHESGTAVTEIIRKLGISEQTFYRPKKKYAGPGIAELRRLKQLDFVTLAFGSRAALTVWGGNATSGSKTHGKPRRWKCD